MQVVFERVAIWQFRTLLISILSIFLLACNTKTNSGESMSKLILSSTKEQLQFTQAKITYLGEQTKPIATIVFHTLGYKVEMQDFAKSHHTGELYTNDELPYTQFFTITPQAFSNILENLTPILSDPIISQGPDFLSFTVLRKENSNIVSHEFKINSATGRRFYPLLLKALNDDNPMGKQILQKQFSNIFPQ